MSVRVYDGWKLFVPLKFKKVSFYTTLYLIYLISTTHCNFKYLIHKSQFLENSKNFNNNKKNKNFKQLLRADATAPNTVFKKKKNEKQYICI